MDFFSIAGVLLIISILLLSQGLALYNGHLSGEISHHFLGVKFAEGVTSQNISQYGSTLLILSVITISTAFFCYRKFLKLVPVLS